MPILDAKALVENQHKAPSRGASSSEMNDDARKQAQSQPRREGRVASAKRIPSGKRVPSAKRTPSMNQKEAGEPAAQ